jgi:hypothetical protein
LERICKEAMAAKFKALYFKLYGLTEGNHEMPHDNQWPSEDSGQESPEHKSEALQLEERYSVKSKSSLPHSPS